MPNRRSNPIHPDLVFPLEYQEPSVQKYADDLFGTAWASILGPSGIRPSVYIDSADVLPASEEISAAGADTPAKAKLYVNNGGDLTQAMAAVYRDIIETNSIASIFDSGGVHSINLQLPDAIDSNDVSGANGNAVDLRVQAATDTAAVSATAEIRNTDNDGGLELTLPDALDGTSLIGALGNNVSIEVEDGPNDVAGVAAVAGTGSSFTVYADTTATLGLKITLRQDRTSVPAGAAGDAFTIGASAGTNNDGQSGQAGLSLQGPSSLRTGVRFTLDTAGDNRASLGGVYTVLNNQSLFVLAYVGGATAATVLADGLTFTQFLNSASTFSGGVDGTPAVAAVTAATSHTFSAAGALVISLANTLSLENLKTYWDSGTDIGGTSEYTDSGAAADIIPASELDTAKNFTGGANLIDAIQGHSYNSGTKLLTIELLSNTLLTLGTYWNEHIIPTGDTTNGATLVEDTDGNTGGGNAINTDHYGTTASTDFANGVDAGTSTANGLDVTLPAILSGHDLEGEEGNDWDLDINSGSDDSVVGTVSGGTGTVTTVLSGNTLGNLKAALEDAGFTATYKGEGESSDTIDRIIDSSNIDFTGGQNGGKSTTAGIELTLPVSANTDSVDFTGSKGNGVVSTIASGTAGVSVASGAITMTLASLTLGDAATVWEAAGGDTSYFGTGDSNDEVQADDTASFSGGQEGLPAQHTNAGNGIPDSRLLFQSKDRITAQRLSVFVTNEVKDSKVFKVSPGGDNVITLPENASPIIVLDAFNKETLQEVGAEADIEEDTYYWDSANRQLKFDSTSAYRAVEVRFTYGAEGIIFKVAENQLEFFLYVGKDVSWSDLETALNADPVFTNYFEDLDVANNLETPTEDAGSASSNLTTRQYTLKGAQGSPKIVTVTVTEHSLIHVGSAVPSSDANATLVPKGVELSFFIPRGQYLYGKTVESAASGVA